MTMSILHHKPNQKKVGFKLSLLLLPVLFSFLFSCRYQVPESSLKAVSQKTKDSVDYLPEHYYTLNSNFEVTSDSLLLQQLPLIDVLPVYKGEKLVVAEFMVQAADTVDSVWVKVARDQETMGWVREGELLKKVVPVDPISQFIHLFSSSHTVAFFVILALFGMGYLYRAVRKKRLQLIWFNDIDSIFPNILTLLMATAATLYSSIQHFVPDIWERFYYNPSLNPLDLPFILSLFMLCLGHCSGRAGNVGRFISSGPCRGGFLLFIGIDVLLHLSILIFYVYRLLLHWISLSGALCRMGIQKHQTYFSL